MNVGCFPIYLCLLSFLSAVFCSFQWMSFVPAEYIHLFNLYSLFLKLFVFFLMLLSGIVFLISFLDYSLLVYSNATGYWGDQLVGPCIFLKGFLGSFDVCLWLGPLLGLLKLPRRFEARKLFKSHLCSLPT